MIELIKKFVEEAIYAPSGGNSQPWSFEIRNDKLFIYNLPEKDNPILNFKQTGSYIAHGCLIENISIIARHYGYQAHISLFNDSIDRNLVATISFEIKSESGDKFFEYIRLRHTNRKIYNDKKIDMACRKSMLDACNQASGINFFIAEDKSKRTKLAEAASTMEKIALEDPLVHKAFFREIIWKADENKNGKEGLYIKTLELPLPIQYLFKLIKIWSFTWCLNKIGFSKAVAKTNAKIYGSGGGIGIITMDEYDPKKFIEVGRTMQKVWLIATKYGLSIQPITGILFLAHRISYSDDFILDKKYIEEVEKAYKDIRGVLNTENNLPVFMFRIGYADKVTSRSGRQAPKIT